MQASWSRPWIGSTRATCSTCGSYSKLVGLPMPWSNASWSTWPLSGMARAQPDWALLQCPHADQLPALRWKLANLSTFQRRRPQDFIAQADALDTGFATVALHD